MCCCQCGQVGTRCPRPDHPAVADTFRSYRRTAFANDDIASVALAPTGVSLAAVGFWGSNEVKIISPVDLNVMETIVEASLPRSILVRKDPADLGDDKLLLVIGNGDGSVTTRTLSLQDDCVALGGRNTLAMGKTPVHLAASPSQAQTSQMLCLSDRVSVLYEEQERLSRSAFNLSVSRPAASLRGISIDSKTRRA